MIPYNLPTSVVPVKSFYAVVCPSFTVRELGTNNIFFTSSKYFHIDAALGDVLLIHPEDVGNEKTLFGTLPILKAVCVARVKRNYES